MALVLNGSGSITGLSAGGLPDGSVTADDIASLPAGSVLQVVQGTSSVEAYSTSSSWSDTGLTATITPSSASNTILIIVSQNGLYKESTNTGVMLQLLRDATPILIFGSWVGYTNTTTNNTPGSSCASYIHTPSTTSAVTYKTQFASSASTSGVSVQTTLGGVRAASTITLMEIAG
jgi:hypothetical protein